MTEEKTPQQEYDEMFSRLQTDDKYAAAMAYVMKQDFLSYMVTMFYLINCQRMMLKDFHLTVIKKLQGLVDGTNEKRNLALCLPVGSGKSLLTEYFISWCFARSRDNAFVYTSHSEDLITKMSAEIRSICTFPMWQRLFGWVLKKDDRQKTNFSFEGAKNRTGLRAKAINSAITGLDCFDYNELIWTEKGAVKIGELVEKKMDLKIWSYNLQTNQFELKPIQRYIKRRKSKLIKVKFDDGTVIKCTPTHCFYTDKGYVEAQNLDRNMLLFSNTLDSRPSNIKFFSNGLFRNSCIANKLDFFISKMPFIMNFRSDNFDNMSSGNISPILTSLDRGNVASADTVISSDFTSNSVIHSDSECLFGSNFKRVVRVISTAPCCTMSNRIFHIIGLSAVCKIFKTVISSCAIKMSDFNTLHLMSDKSPHDKSMDCYFEFTSFLHESNSRITSRTKMWFNKLPLVRLVSSLLKNCASFTSNSAFVRNAVKSFKRWYRFPSFICDVFHYNTSYCVTVQDNNNLFISKSQILASNCGNPAVDGFSGSLVIDDALDAGNAIYEIERENVIRIYKEKLATRRRTPTTPTILIMQRLHPEDLVGWAEKNEPELWDIVKVKALNDDCTSFWEERYPAEELMMLQKRQGALFQAQYQQEPVITGGSVIKTEWFKYYQQHPKYERIFMTSDTAMKANEWNDYSVLQLWGKYQNGLYLIDMIRGKWEVPDLIQKTRDFVKKYRLWENRILLSALYVEDRGSGVGLIQQLRRETSVPILPLKPNKKDKVTRAKEIAYYIESGMVFLPQDKDYSFNRELLTEVELFSANGQNKHDDQCFDGSTLIATLRGDIPIKDVKIGDYVITPFGLKKVLNCGITGYKETINKFGLEVTSDHKIFANGAFDRIDKLVYNCDIDRLTYGGLLKWMYQKVLFSMESNLTLSGREGIISVRQQQMLHEKILKDFMLRCGNFITDGKYLKVVLFTIKTITHLIMTSLIWSVYQLQNIMPSILKEEVSLEVLKNSLNIWKKSENLQKNGTQVKKDENGIGNILKRLWKRKDILKFVPNVDKNLKLAEQEQYVENAKINYGNENYVTKEMEQSLDKSLKELVLSAERNLRQDTQDKNTVAKNALRPVYNLTIEDIGCFYANGILVSNCDAMIYAVNVGLAGSGSSIFDA